MTQLSLTTEYVQLTDQEILTAARALAEQLRTRRLVLDEHRERKKAMKDEVAVIDAEIARIEQVVRSGQEERPIGTARG